ncbi:protein translocase subunit SecD, partial [bacterium]|nr:protein translocase subunit SecD [bacterium]
MKIVGFGAPPPALGTKIEVFDPMGQGAEAEPEETTDVQWIDITMDKVILTGDDFADADVQFDQLGQSIIGFEFKDSGRTIFGRFTAQHVQQFLAIALDDKIISCPVIREPILNGRGIIQGSFTPQEAQDLVVKLDSGRLPVKLEVIENRTVGPTLGQKSIDDSKSAALLGAALILLFMALYYRLPGLLADLALIYYVAVFFGALSVLNATLTHPGIEGFILSIGMAVDANVIIFERLKEELKTGKTFRSATDTAFKRAFLAIFDANVTTLITALVLYNLGNGPIRGFAVTLSLGILVSMFSA